jgi:hypothetical protein
MDSNDFIRKGIGMRYFLKFVAVLLLGYLFYAHPSQAAETSGQELGIAVGTPSEISYQYEFSERNAMNLGLAYDSDHFVYISGDYHWRVHSLVRSPLVTPYVGAGLFAAFHTRSYDESHHDYYGVRNPDVVAAVRIPFGLEVRPAEVPLTIFGELVPALTVSPETTGIFQIALGARFRF